MLLPRVPFWSLIAQDCVFGTGVRHNRLMSRSVLCRDGSAGAAVAGLTKEVIRKKPKKTVPTSKEDAN